MQSTQEIAELMLDSGRNALLALDVKISIATLGVGTGALIAGMFGMNVSWRPSNFRPETDWYSCKPTWRATLTPSGSSRPALLS